MRFLEKSYESEISQGLAYEKFAFFGPSKLQGTKQSAKSCKNTGSFLKMLTKKGVVKSCNYCNNIAKGWKDCENIAESFKNCKKLAESWKKTARIL